GDGGLLEGAAGVTPHPGPLPRALRAAHSDRGRGHAVRADWPPAVGARDPGFAIGMAVADRHRSRRYPRARARPLRLARRSLVLRRATTRSEDPPRVLRPIPTPSAATIRTSAAAVPHASRARGSHPKDVRGEARWRASAFTAVISELLRLAGASNCSGLRARADAAGR